MKTFISNPRLRREKTIGEATPLIPLTQPDWSLEIEKQGSGLSEKDIEAQALGGLVTS